MKVIVNSDCREYLSRIDDMRMDEKNRWKWAEATLTSIYDQMSDRNFITESQKAAVQNIYSTVFKD